MVTKPVRLKPGQQATVINTIALKRLQNAARKGRELAEGERSVLTKHQQAQVVNIKLSALYPDAIAYIEKMMQKDSPLSPKDKVNLAVWIVEMREGKPPMYHEVTGAGGEPLIPARPLGGYSDADLLALDRMLTTFKQWEGKKVKLPQGQSSDPIGGKEV